MIKCLLSDFSQVILFPKDDAFSGSLNKLYAEKLGTPEFSFFDLYTLNTPLLAYYQQLQESHDLEMNIFTTGTVQSHPDLEPYLLPIFSNVISVTELHIEKTNPEAYRTIVKDLEFEPSEVVFVDDTLSNVEAAREAGLHALQFISNDQLKHDMLSLLS